MVGYLILTLILVILVAFLGYLVYQNVLKIESLEEIIEEKDDKIIEIKQSIDAALSYMKNADSKGMFESDDYVGSTFKELKLISDGLDEEIKLITENTETIGKEGR